MSAKWIRFFKGERLNGRKTDVWRVRSVQGDDFLGIVHWYTGWRKYVFAPEFGAEFEQDCMRDIADFCECATREHKQAKALT